MKVLTLIEGHVCVCVCVCLRLWLLFWCKSNCKQTNRKQRGQKCFDLLLWANEENIWGMCGPCGTLQVLVPVLTLSFWDKGWPVCLLAAAFLFLTHGPELLVNANTYALAVKARLG